MRTVRCNWANAERKDHTVLWVMLAGIVISTYLTIAI